MAEEDTGSKKAVTKKAAVKKKAATKKSVKKAVSKKAASKKATIKKAVSKQASAAKEKINIIERRKNNTDTMVAIKALLGEMRQDHDNRDKQITSLVREIQQGFSTISDYSKEQEAEREAQMVDLYKSIDNAFEKAETTTQTQEERSLLILKTLSDSIMADHEKTLQEVQEQKLLQDKKIEHLTKLQEQKHGRNRWIAIPGMIIAIIAIVYMFYVVTIMEEAMTSMSGNMTKIQAAVGNMSNKMDIISVDTSSMNTNMSYLNGNMAQMSRDLNVMTYSVAPTMNNMNDMMPW